VFQNGIKIDGMTHLIKSLASNPQLVSIKLNDNLIKSASTELLNSLTNLQELEVLDMSDSLLGAENSISIFKVLSILPKIREVYCNYNDIESKNSAERNF